MIKDVFKEFFCLTWHEFCRIRLNDDERAVKMKYELIEIIKSIFELLNNPVGITSIITSFLTGILMCIYGNLKSRIVCGCSLLVLAIFSIIVCLVQNSPDYLILPLL